MKTQEKHRATIETLTNTIALALTAVGVNLIIAKDYYGFVIIGFGMLLEYIKYYGRYKGLW